jgi:hypothetical protein
MPFTLSAKQTKGAVEGQQAQNNKIKERQTETNE